MAEMSREEMMQFPRSNVKRVHESAVASAKERNQRFEMSLQDTTYLMFHHELLFDEEFELPPDLTGPCRDDDYDNTRGLPADLIEPAATVTIH
jgi:hypothetical protein